MKISILCALIGIFISGCESSSSTTTSKTTIRGNGGSGNDGGSSNNNDEILKINWMCIKKTPYDSEQAVIWRFCQRTRTFFLPSPHV